MRLKDNKVYIVTAYRWGGRENHSYLVGVFSKKAAAFSTAVGEESYRGGKYECEIAEMVVDAKGNKDRKLLRELYTDTCKEKDQRRCSWCGAPMPTTE